MLIKTLVPWSRIFKFCCVMLVILILTPYEYYYQSEQEEIIRPLSQDSQVTEYQNSDGSKSYQVNVYLDLVFSSVVQVKVFDFSRWLIHGIMFNIIGEVFQEIVSRLKVKYDITQSLLLFPFGY